MAIEYCGNFPGCYRRRFRAYVWRDAKFIGLYLVGPCVLAGLLCLSILVFGEGGSMVWTVMSASFTGAALFLWLFFSTVSGNRMARMIPYFAQRVDDITTSGRGQEVAENCRQLDALAEKAGAPALSEFGFGDDFEGEEPVWHDPAEGLKTVGALAEAVAADPVLSSVKNLQSDLKAWRTALERARAKGIRFCLILRHGTDSTRQQRKGSLW